MNYDELIDGVRDEAKEYLDKKVAEMKKLGVAKVSALSKEGFAGDEIIALGHKTPDAFDRHVFPWPVRRQTLGAGQRDRKCRAPQRRPGAGGAGEVIEPAQGTTVMYSKILVPLDGSTAAESALPLVRSLARRLALPVELLGVIDLREISRSVSAADGLFLDRLARR